MHCLGFQLWQNPNSSQSSSAFKDCMFETKEINDSGLWLESSLGLCMHRLGLFGVKSVAPEPNIDLQSSTTFKDCMCEIKEINDPGL